MLRPTQLALDHRDEFDAHRPASTSAPRRSPAPATSAPSSCATRATSTPRTTRRPARWRPRSTSLLLDPQIEIAVLRGGVVEHPRYAGRRIFGAGLNLTHLYRGQISYLFFPVRDLGLVHKVFRGLTDPSAPDDTEKLWIAAAETFAIGGGCQLLLAVDHILAEAGHAAARCPRATRASSPAPPTCGSRASSATAARARRSSPTASSRPRNWPTTSSRRARWTPRSSAPPRTC